MMLITLITLGLLIAFGVGLLLGRSLGGGLRSARGNLLDRRSADGRPAGAGGSTLQVFAPQPRADHDERYLQQRDELFATLGHELRSPLRALLGLLSPTAGEREAQARALAAHALRVAEDSLDFALLERDTLELRDAPMDLEQILAEVVVIARPQRRGDTRLQIDLARGLVLQRRGDAARLRQVLVNLLGNALAYTEHGVVRLILTSGERSPQHLRIDVTDTGAGMTVVERSRAFQVFAQGDRARGRAGIGLAVVARLVDAMGGRIELDSSAGLGTRFRLELPLPLTSDHGIDERLRGHSVLAYCEHADDAQLLRDRLAELGASAVLNDAPRALTAALAGARRDAGAGPVTGPMTGPMTGIDGVVVIAAKLDQELEQRLRNLEALGTPVLRAGLAEPERWLPGALGEALAPAAPAHEERLHVLVVDDHPVVRRALADCLRAQGALVTTAEDGLRATALAECADPGFDWVLLDRRMPGMDGLATAAQLRLLAATATAQLTLLVNDAADDPGAPELFDQVLLRPADHAALAAMLRLAAPDPRSSGRAPGLDPTLVALRDETLREDLSALADALEGGDDGAAGDLLHRMEGALRVCPDPTLTEAFAELKCACEADGTAAAARLSAFAACLGSDRGPVRPALDH